MSNVPLNMKKREVRRIDPQTGLVAKSNVNAVNVTEAFIDLPSAQLPSLNVETDRNAEAVLYAPVSILEELKGTLSLPTVVFLHGFSQRPKNYGSTLQMLAANGFVVIAPRVWLLDIAFAEVEGSSLPGKRRASLPAKLQTALLIDALRCVTIARDSLGAQKVVLLGHSMGGAMALVAARALKIDDVPVDSVITLAPAVGPTVHTPVNPLLALDDKEVGSKGLQQFCETYGDVPTLIIHGDRDAVVPAKDVDATFNNLANHRIPQALTLLGRIAQSSHVGFEDSLNVDLPILKMLDVLIFKIIDFFVFGPFDFFIDTKSQLALTKSLVLPWFDAVRSDPVDPHKLLAQIQGLPTDDQKVSYTWNGFERSIETVEQ